MIDLPYFQFSTIIGLYLSDGCSVLSYIKNVNSNLSQRNAYFNFTQSFHKFNYFMLVFSILSHYCSKLPISKIGFMPQAGE
jgi:hypothetical protein